MPMRPEATYLEEVGWALYTFQALEWEVINPLLGSYGSDVSSVSSGTTRQIATEFSSVAAEHHELREFAQRFQELTDRRNDLVHSRPATDDRNQERLQRLFRREVNRTRTVTAWIDEEWLATFISDVGSLNQALQANRDNLPKS